MHFYVIIDVCFRFVSYKCIIYEIIYEHILIIFIFWLITQQVLEGREIRVRSGPPPPKDDSAPLRGYRGGAQGDGYRGGSQGGDEYRVHVGNLSWGVDNSSLKTLFSEQGRVVEAKVIYDRETGRSRGFGFVTYGSADEVENAIESLNGAVSSSLCSLFFL